MTTWSADDVTLLDRWRMFMVLLSWDMTTICICSNFSLCQPDFQSGFREWCRHIVSMSTSCWIRHDLSELMIQHHQTEILIFGHICHVLLICPLAVWIYRLWRNKKFPRQMKSHICTKLWLQQQFKEWWNSNTDWPFQVLPETNSAITECVQYHFH